MKSIFHIVAAIISPFSLIYAQGFAPTEECPLLGPGFSSNFDLSETDAFLETVEAFPNVINSLFASGCANGNTSSFIIDVYSATTNTSLYTYTHQATAPTMNETFPASFDDSTSFRIGSVTKIFTVYAILAHAGNISILDDPVTKYLPELADNRDIDPLHRIVYEDITIGALASHQGGTGTFSYEDSACTLDASCSIPGFLTRMRDNKRATQPPYASALYSDGGYGLLGRILERMTNQSYSDALASTLSHPLNLTSTFASLPTNSNSTSSSTTTPINAITIPGASSLTSAWGLDNPITAPSGGIYASTADMRALGLSILHSSLLSPADTRRWMKPLARTASLSASVGAPWEVFSLTLPQSSVSPYNSSASTSGSGSGDGDQQAGLTQRYRISDLYTKAGGQPGYSSVFMLSPDHQLGITVQVAGETAGFDRWTLRAAAAEAFVGAAERAGRERAVGSEAGSFVRQMGEGEGEEEQGEEVGGMDIGSNLTLTVDEGRPGLGLKEWFFNGTDMRPELMGPGFVLPEGMEMVVRLYPTGLSSALSAGDGAGGGGDGVVVVDKYRAAAEVKPWRLERARVENEGVWGWFDDRCAAWLSRATVEDLVGLGTVADEFLLQRDAEGRVVGVVNDYTGVRMLSHPPTVLVCPVFTQHGRPPEHDDARCG